MGETKLFEVSDKDLPDLLRALDDAIAARGDDGNELTHAMVNRINQAARGYFCIDWYGSFDELASGTTNFALQVRAHFWEFELEDVYAEADLREPIPNQRVSDFVKFIAEYGVCFEAIGKSVETPEGDEGRLDKLLARFRLWHGGLHAEPRGALLARALPAYPHG